MFQNAVAAFVGCFSAFVALAEIPATNKAIRYLAAFVLGIVVTFVLAWLCGWVAGVFAHIGH
jgi:hypothetical protein